MSNEENEAYRHTAHCNNCGDAHVYLIPKGTTISDFMARQTCSNCGCRMAASEHRPRKDDYLMRGEGNVLGSEGR